MRHWVDAAHPEPEDGLTHNHETESISSVTYESKIAGICYKARRT